MAEGHPNYSSNDGGSLELMHFLGISPAALPTSAPLTDPRRARTLVETHFSLRPPVMPNQNTFGLMTTSGTQIIQTQPTSGTLFQTQPLDLRSSPTPLPRPANTFTWRQNHVENIWRPRPNHTENRR